ncbi:tripartite motif-containing protein 16-like isoform X2 [Polypterus senegalus]|uniref:tripartite motif-containing protein 16-like isoform X2 n=1 Tax=Polypterus senegalus TaxID=55291 RepID=UPI001962AC42|nr:tripartite motif-containing protein 16-like isoform X2 [Polypterus senegalus]
MAAAYKPAFSADQYSCPVCLEVLKEPVTPHNYCVDCINDYWNQPDTEGGYKCPQCRRPFNERPELNKNIVLTELIEKLKEATDDGGPSESYAGPDDVSCDVCTGRKLKAVKSCLTCMASYCEIHLQPHLRSEVLKRHKLGESTGNLEEKICEKHQKVLEIYCRSDQTCVCLVCVATEHKNHDTVTPEEERAARQSSAEREVQEHEKIFRSVLESIERLRSEVIEVIRGHERRKVRKAKEFMEQLEKEIKELKRRNTELAKLSQIDNHIHFLKKFPSLCFPLGDQDIPATSVTEDLLPETLRMSLSDLKKSLEEISSWEIVKISEPGVDDSRHIPQNLRTRNGLLKYFCPLTLDPNTANNCLYLSAGNKKVTSQMKKIPYPKHPDRFDSWLEVLCREALSGTRCYWEVEWSGKEIDIGVTYKGIARKGERDESALGRNDKSWDFCCSVSGYTAWHNNKTMQISAPCSHRIGVYLDWSAGSLSFYSISHTMTLLHTFNASFTEPLYPGFGFVWDSSVTICPLNPPD